MRLHAFLVSVVAILGVCSVAAVAGPLDPPAGPVEPTHKTLTEVEPRIAVNAANTPGTATALFQISQPGSYYLTGNITGVGGRHGIEIIASGVTLDLNGFVLRGTPGSLDGIHQMDEFRDNIVIRNGHIRSWGGSGINARIDSGRLEEITAAGNGAHGIGNDSFTFPTLVIDCVARNNGGIGIRCGVASVVSGCIAHTNTGGGISVNATSMVSGCTVRHNGDFGVLVTSESVIVNNAVSGAAGGGDGIRVTGSNNRIEGNNVVNHPGAGIRVDGARNFIVRNSARGNTAGNFIAPGTQTIGPIITATGTIADSVSPWANFSY